MRKLTSMVLAAGCAVAPATQPAWSAAGDLDPSFSRDGVVTANVGGDLTTGR